MRILVTAFGPFEGRPQNASSLALAGLKRRFPEIRTRVFPVDMVIAPARLRQAMRRIRPDALVLLGEAAGSKAIRLEETAWNELDFRLPDLAGRLPAPRAIRPSGPASLKSTLPLASLHQRWVENGYPAEISQDPGRYLCNLVFFKALDLLQTSGANCPAGFIHLPLAAEFPTERAVSALAHIIEELHSKDPAPDFICGMPSRP
jgi:pyroglutamyl-peptidase